MTDKTEIFCNANTRDLIVEVRLAESQSPSGIEPLSAARITVPRPSNNFLMQAALRNGDFISLSPSFTVNTDLILRHGDTQVADVTSMLEVFQRLAETLYIASFRNALNIGGSATYYDIQTGESFIRSWWEAKAGTNRRRHEAARRLERDIQGIFEFEDLAINSAPDSKAIQVLINSKSYGLSDVGAGLTHFILVLASAATRAPAPSLILIDEPETGLHPSLQLDFLTTLASYATEGVVFATHSIGLARAVAENIYSVRKLSEGESQVSLIDETPNLAEFLGALGFASYKELGFEKVLLVEGPTDVRTIQQWLRLYSKDHQVVLLPLGGEALINESRQAELAEVTRITPQVFAIIDSERRSPGEAISPGREAFVQACKNLNIECLVLERRATENYLTDPAVKVALGERFRALGPYEGSKTSLRYGRKRITGASPARCLVMSWRAATSANSSKLSETQPFKRHPAAENRGSSNPEFTVEDFADPTKELPSSEAACANGLWSISPDPRPRDRRLPRRGSKHGHGDRPKPRRRTVDTCLDR